MINPKLQNPKAAKLANTRLERASGRMVVTHLHSYKVENRALVCVECGAKLAK